MADQPQSIDVEKLVMPADCADPELGQRYWEFVRNPQSVPNCDERITLLEHCIRCPACLQQVLEHAREIEGASLQN